MVGQRIGSRRVEECEHDAQRADGDQPPAAVKEQSAARDAGGRGRQGDSATHGAGCDPALCAGPFGAQPVFAVGAFEVIPEVVDEVGVYLHQEGEQQAQHGGLQVKISVRSG